MVPEPDQFSIEDVRKLVGGRTKIHVICCNKQTTDTMTLSQFTKYYQAVDRHKVYNVLSLEFSETAMDKIVQRPRIVGQLDWTTLLYPHCITSPKFRKYCLMSVGGSYTNFHIDFGGSSVWYHVLKGRKVFWLIEPTPENLEIFKTWYSEGAYTVFLGDLVAKCQRITLEEGHTFMLPSGWIHAVYTPIDSLVFGGNFLHSYNVANQIRVSELEVDLEVQKEYIIPFTNKLHWYVLEMYVRRLGGGSFLEKPPTAEVTSMNGGIRLGNLEAEGLSLLVQSLDQSKFTDVVDGIVDLPKLHFTANKLLAANGKANARSGVNTAIERQKIQKIATM